MRNNARLFFLVGSALLVACATMTGLFGWSKGNGDITAGTAYAIAFVAADILGAGFMSFSASCAATGETRDSRRAFVVALMCMGMTLAGILGFQSESREIQASARKASMQIMESFVGWSKDLVTAKEKDAAKSKGKALPPESLKSSIDAVGDRVTAQLEMLANGKLAPVTDGQAATVARVTGLSEDSSRSWIVTVTSLFLLVIQYSAWWAYGVSGQKLEPSVSGINEPLGDEENEGNFPDNGGKITRKKEAKDDFHKLIAGGAELCVGEYAKRWGISYGGASKRLTEFSRSGGARRVWRGGRRVYVAFKHLNGNGVGHA